MTDEERQYPTPVTDPREMAGWMQREEDAYQQGRRAARAALLAVEWYMNEAGSEGFCTRCGADYPGPHDPDCIVGAALATYEKKS